MWLSVVDTFRDGEVPTRFVNLDQVELIEPGRTEKGTWYLRFKGGCPDSSDTFTIYTLHLHGPEDAKAVLEALERAMADGARLVRIRRDGKGRLMGKPSMAFGR